MKKVYSISLNDKLVNALDQYCLELGQTRSDVIAKLLIDNINNGIDPDEVENDYIYKRKLELLNAIYDLYFSISEFEDFTSKFNLDIKVLEENLSILFESSNDKFYCELKALEDSIKINVRYKSSSSKMHEIFERAYEKHKNILEEHGFKREIYQRFWNIEYRHQINEYPKENDIKLFARFLLQKLLILYTHFFIELDFIIERNELGELPKTGPLKEYGSCLNSIRPPYLVALIGAKRGIKYPIEKNYSIKIGRHNVEINLLEQEFDSKLPVISKQHAELLWKGDKLYLVDLGSTNGTMLNGKVISEAYGKKGKEYELMDGDLILIADIELKIVF